MVRLDTDKEGGHDIDIPWEIWGKDDPLLLTEMQNFTKKNHSRPIPKIPWARFFVFRFCWPTHGISKRLGHSLEKRYPVKLSPPNLSMVATDRRTNQPTDGPTNRHSDL